jgi:epoxyqueuosine reductase
MSWPANHEQVPDDVWDDWQRRFAESDRAAGFDISRDFQPFSQMNDMFTRSGWDPSVRTKDSAAFFASYRMDAAPRRGEGFSQRDFALRNAAWSVSDIISNRSADAGNREGFQALIGEDTPVADT